MFYSAFISYGGPDEAVAESINQALKARGVTTWFFKDDAKAGVKLHNVMRDGVKSHDRVILICSEHSLSRPGVMNEIEKVLEREAREGGESILIPITLDDFLFTRWQPGDAHSETRKTEIINRVVANFEGIGRSGLKFNDAIDKLVLALTQ